MKRWIALLCLVSGLASALGSNVPESRLHALLQPKGPALPDTFVTYRGEAPRVGLYVGRGTWATGKEHLKMFLSEHGFSYRTFSASQVRNGELESSGVKLVIFPGGESWVYLDDLGDTGARHVKAFVSSGGGYIGICAGAFYATSEREGGTKTGHYGIGLLEGTAYDGTALGTAPFKEGMLDFDVTNDSFMSGLQAHYRSVLLGGPSFRYTDAEAAAKHLHVLMRFQQIDEPAMITFEYGQGRVFLSAPHLEVEEDRTDWGPDYYDPDSEWPILDRVAHYLLKDTLALD